MFNYKLLSTTVSKHLIRIWNKKVDVQCKLICWKNLSIILGNILPTSLPFCNRYVAFKTISFSFNLPYSCNRTLRVFNKIWERLIKMFFAGIKTKRFPWFIFWWHKTTPIMTWKWAPNLCVKDYPRAHHHKRHLNYFYLFSWQKCFEKKFWINFPLIVVVLGTKDMSWLNDEISSTQL